MAQYGWMNLLMLSKLSMLFWGLGFTQIFDASNHILKLYIEKKLTEKLKLKPNEEWNKLARSWIQKLKGRKSGIKWRDL